MKLLHTSDWHLGRMAGETPLYEDQVFFIDAICNIAKEYSVDAVIIAGDIFDRSAPSAEAVSLYNMAMTKLCVELGIRVIAVAGNHDSAERVENCNRLLERAGLYVLGSINAEPIVVNLGDTDIFLMPWVKESRVKCLYPAEADNIGSLEDAYRVLNKKMLEKATPGRKRILVTHSFMTGATTSESDRTAVLGTADQVGAGVFSDFDYVALGHIHKPQDIGGNARYSGTPMPYSFGAEEKQEKSVTIIDTDTMERTIVPVPLLHKRVTIEGTLDEILNGQYDADTLNAYTKVVVNDAYVGLDAMTRLEAKFNNLLEVTGLTYDDKDSKITLTMDELRELESDPVAIFKSFFRDIINSEPDEDELELFEKCVREYEEVEK
ncbi:MAG: exonuclease SbcCD subunit D [Eubacteriales bacterium]|nr:exonuclease SbcCD subunit D [Eubacteriales bacterium]